MSDIRQHTSAYVGRGVFEALAETRKTDATVFICDFECGFTGSFEQVSAHVS
jgi:hypothetical protein